MKKSLSRSFRPSLETLEGRVVPAVTRVVPPLNGTLTPDTQLTIGTRQTPSGRQVVIDGSIHDDNIVITKFDRAKGFMEVKLEQWSGGVNIGTKIGPGKVVRLHGLTNLQPLHSIFVEGKNGNDVIDNLLTSASILALGGSGHDRIYGGTGHDRLIGNEGNDHIGGSAGNDWLSGDNGDNNPNVQGNDLLQGSTGNDVLGGDAGDDKILGSAGMDSLIGGPGNDHMEGGDDDDTLVGDAGNDTLLGQGGGDFLYGGADDDYLDAGRDVTPNLNYAEHLQGDGGADTYVRHVVTFGSDDPDHFVGFNSAQGDKIKKIRHTF